MTRHETQELLMSIQACYSHFNPKNKTVTIDTWHYMLEDYEYSEVSGALKAYVLTDAEKNRPPGIGQIIDRIHTTTRPQELNELEAWDLVAKAISNGIYHSKREYNKLPPVVQKAVGSPDSIRSWAMSCTSEEIHSVIQSHFIKTYRSTVIREKEQAKLPPELRQITKKTAESLETKSIEEIKPEKKAETTNVPEWVTERLRSGMFA